MNLSENPPIYYKKNYILVINKYTTLDTSAYLSRLLMAKILKYVFRTQSQTNMMAKEDKQEMGGNN